MDMPHKPDTKRHNRWRAAAMMALVAAIMFATVLHDDLPQNPDARSGLIIRYAVAMALGGALAGYLLAGLFGRPGMLGWIMALLGGLLASLVSGFAGSLIGLSPELLLDGVHTSDLIAIFAGILVLPFALADGLTIALAWIVLILLTHVWIKRHPT